MEPTPNGQAGNHRAGVLASRAPLPPPPRDGPGPMAPEGHEPDHLSWSQLQAWLHCPRAYAYRHVLGAEPAFTPQPLALGVAVHAGLAHHYRTLLESGQQGTPESMRSVVGTSLSSHEPAVRLDDGDSIDALTEQALTLIGAVMTSPLGLTGESGAQVQIVGVEEPLAGCLADDLPPFHAYVDLVTRHEPDGQPPVVTIRDFKTTRSSWTSAQAREHAGQLALYKALLPTEPGAAVRLEFVTISKGRTTKVEQVPVDDADASVHTVLDQARQIVAGLRAGCFPARPGWGCASCPFSHRCPHAAV